MHRPLSNSLAAAIAAAMLTGAGLFGQNVAVPGRAGAGESVPAAPLVQPGEEQPAPGGWIMREEAAKRALALGFSPAAEALLAELLASPETVGAVRNRLLLELTAALLDQGRLEEVDNALARFTEPRTSPYHLRAALVAAYRKQGEAARIEAGQVKIDELPAQERGWFHFLQGMIADLAGDRGRRDQAYEEAVRSAVSEQQRARFELERLHIKLLSGTATEQEAAALKQNMERLQGQRIGYDFARSYAITMNALGRKTESVTVLQRQLQSLPPEEKQVLDDMRLLLGLIAGPESGVGRNALFGLLERAVSRESQRAALQLLARGSDNGKTRAEFRAKLDQLIAEQPPHPIKEDLLVFRAQVAMEEGNYGQAEEDAQALLERFPGSQLKAQALGVLTGVAWELRRYRSAADHAAQLRAELPPGDARAQLGVLVADADFQAGDYANAADAYASAERERPAAVKPGVLHFQRVLSEIRDARKLFDAAQLEAAQRRLNDAEALLDEAAGAAGADAESRWEGEWNLARAFQVHGRTAEALERVTRLVKESGAAALPQDLSVRMAWLQARLAFEAGSPAEAIQMVDALLARLGSPGAAALPAAFKSLVASTSVLLKAQALLASSRTHPADAQQGLDLLKKLRADYPDSDAAVYSFIAEADYDSARNVIVEAQRLCTNLADTYPRSKYAPFALFEAALNAERLGQDSSYEEANRLIERLVTDYPGDELVFYARLKQGDVLRKRNEFGSAQRAYEFLTNNFPQHRDVLNAQLALAECHFAQAASDPSHWESALAIYERLQDLPDAPVDLRVEAGFMHGYLLSRKGAMDRAQAAWMLVINGFLLEPEKAAELGAKGRYWMSRTLLELGDLYERGAMLDQARRAYELMLAQKLPGGALAQQRLARFSGEAGGGEARPAAQ
jgi:outer membrane protein assembly factor BamD (BamD/ComL family)